MIKMMCHAKMHSISAASFLPLTFFLANLLSQKRSQKKPLCLYTRQEKKFLEAYFIKDRHALQEINPAFIHFFFSHKQQNAPQPPLEYAVPLFQWESLRLFCRMCVEMGRGVQETPNAPLTLSHMLCAWCACCVYLSECGVR